MNEPGDTPERRGGVVRFSIRGLLAATAAAAFLVVAIDDSSGPGKDVLFCIALGGLAFQSVAAWSSPKSVRLPPLTSAVFGWTALLGIRFLAPTSSRSYTVLEMWGPWYPLAVIVFLLAGVWSGQILARRIALDATTR